MAHADSTAAHGGTAFGNVFNAIFDGLMAIAESSGRMRTVERLNAMSDEDLAKLGVDRADIARHVFRDILYI